MDVSSAGGWKCTVDAGMMVVCFSSVHDLVEINEAEDQARLELFTRRVKSEQ